MLIETGEAMERMESEDSELPSAFIVFFISLFDGLCILMSYKG